MKVPSVASGKLEAGIGNARPSAVYLPSRGPSSKAPASAAQPPTEWTIVDPAKSEKPSIQPPSAVPPQVQCP